MLLMTVLPESWKAGCHKIVSHDAKAVFDVFVEILCRLRLGDVEKSEQGEGGGLPEPGVRRQQQDYPEGYDFVPDNAAVVGVAKRTASDVNEPDATKVSCGEQEKQLKITKVWPEEHEARTGEQGAEGAGRLGGEAAATAEREEVRRVGEHETDVRASRAVHHGQNGRSRTC